MLDHLEAINQLDLSQAAQDLFGEALTQVTQVPFVQQTRDVAGDYPEYDDEDDFEDDEDFGGDGRMGGGMKGPKGGQASWSQGGGMFQGGETQQSGRLWLPNLLVDVAGVLVFALQAALVLTNLLINGTTLVNSIPFYAFTMLPIAAVFLKVWGQQWINRLYRGGMVSLAIGGVIASVLSVTSVVSNGVFLGLGAYYLSQSTSGAPSMAEVILAIFTTIAWVAYTGFEGYYAFSAYMMTGGQQGDGWDEFGSQGGKGGYDQYGGYGGYGGYDDYEGSNGGDSRPPPPKDGKN